MCNNNTTTILSSFWRRRSCSHAHTLHTTQPLTLSPYVRKSTGRPPTVEELVADMDYIMSQFLAADQKWVLLGPSMGSIVAQSYMWRHPEKVVGLLNMDGFPHGFCDKRAKFVDQAGMHAHAYQSHRPSRAHRCISVSLSLSAFRPFSLPPPPPHFLFPTHSCSPELHVEASGEGAGSAQYGRIPPWLQR